LANLNKSCYYITNYIDELIYKIEIKEYRTVK